MDTLIIEDDEAIQTLIEGVVERRNHRAVICGSAEEGEKEWKQSHPLLMILDIHLPGMDGLEFCKWLRKQPGGRDTYIIVCTGDGELETFHKVLTAGADDYITKPLNPKLLAIRIDIAANQIQQIVKKRELQKEIEESERRFRLLSEHSRDLICTHTPTGEIKYISPSCRHILGKEPEELIGRTLKDFCSEPKLEPLDLNCGTEEDNGQLESTQTWPTMTEKGKIWLETYTHALRDERNRVSEIYSYSRDVSDSAREEEQLKMLRVLGTENDSAAFLQAIVEDMETRMQAGVCIHINATSAERLAYTIPGKSLDAEGLAMHKQIHRETPPTEPVFQGRHAGNVFHNVSGSETIEGLITQPIPGTFGRPLGKITITSTHPIPEGTKTRDILELCANKIGCVLETHINRG